MLTDYYKLAQPSISTSVHRRESVASTGGYAPFENIAQHTRDGKIVCYLTKVPHNYISSVQERAAWTLRGNNKPITSIYTPDLRNPLRGCGDIHGTNDAALFIISADYKVVEIFIARGMKANVHGLFAVFARGELDGEIMRLRMQAKAINTRPPEARQMALLG